MTRLAPIRVTIMAALTPFSLSTLAQNHARDHAVKKLLPLAGGHQPAAQAQKVPMPTELRWDPVPGARFYQAYVRDEWESERCLLTSKVISGNFLEIPSGLLKPGGSDT